MPAFWASRFGRASARILGFALWACQCPHSGLPVVVCQCPHSGLAVWFGAHSAPASCLRDVGAGVLALILGVRRHLRRVVTIIDHLQHVILFPVRDPHPLSST